MLHFFQQGMWLCGLCLDAATQAAIKRKQLQQHALSSRQLYQQHQQRKAFAQHVPESRPRRKRRELDSEEEEDDDEEEEEEDVAEEYISDNNNNDEDAMDLQEDAFE